MGQLSRLYGVIPHLVVRLLPGLEEGSKGMAADMARVGEDSLEGWAERARSRQSRATTKPRLAHGAGLRFALYGRMSTRTYQERESSSRWQREVAEGVIAGRGVIVAEFFDIGISRRLPWPERPQAAALLSAVAEPERGVDAVVVGEYERAFQDDQAAAVAAVLDRHGVRLWLPEAGGPVDLTSATHQALMLLLGAQSKREVLRSRHRVLTAMRGQARVQGRYLGGRPPYGYRLADAGPHPNPAHASWGRRAHRLAPDPATAEHVRWIFAQRLAGRSVAGIARALNDRGVPCPSRVDRRRNRHRTGEAWTLRTVACILANPRYTGRQVWNRHGTDDNSAASLDGDEQQKLAGEWVISQTVAHPPLISEHDFVAAQAIRAARPTADGSTRTYLLTGLVLCGVCERRMEAHWVNRRAGYRCRHGQTSSRSREPGRLKIRYVREDHLLADLAERYSLTGTLHAIAAEIRDRNITIICRATGSTVTHEQGTHDLGAPDDALFQQRMW
ncbi:hypothetical protein GCM10025762_13610 [Haloechinothrix salitolerans]